MKENLPPRIILTLFKWFCNPAYHSDIEGDLLEIYERKLKSQGKRKADWAFFKDVIFLFRPGIVKPLFNQNPLNSNFMYKHYFKVSVRNILKYRTYSAINILGLIIGMISVLTLAKYVGFFVGFDEFHERSENIYVIHHEEKENGVLKISGEHTYYGMIEYAQENYPEILEASRYEFNVEMLVSTKKEDGYKPVKFNEKNVYTVDSGFFRLFSFEFVHGDPLSALSQPGSVVITSSTAEKYFGNTNVLGKSLQTRMPWGEKADLNITGVVKDIPENSRFQFDFLRTSVGKASEEPWQYPGQPSYFLLKPNSEPNLLGEKMTRDISALEKFEASPKEITLTLKSIEGKLSNTEYMLGIVGVFILIITWINFINLTGANALNRFKEMGVRKVMGSYKSQIIHQFVFESFLLNTIGIICSIFIAWLIFPYITIFTDGQILLLFEWQTPINKIFIGLFLFGSVVSSLYPAIVLSKLDPIKALKGMIFNQTQKVGFRKLLVIFQFSLSIVLVIGIFIISDQMKFMQNQDLGFNMDRKLIVKTAKDGWGGKKARVEAFKTKVKSLPSVEEIASSTMVPGGGNGHEVIFHLQNRENEAVLNLIGIDENYILNFQLKILAGEAFKKGALWKNRRGVILNKTACHLLGISNFEEALETKIINEENGKAYDIFAVIDDYHHQSVKEKIPALVLDYNPFRGHTSIALEAKNYQDYDKLSETISNIEQIWKEVYPDQYFDYYFLDERFNAQYLSEIKFRKIFGVFTGISIFIACLGLFGLSLFVSLKRKKEVGIRKTFGASSLNILFLFTRDYLSQIFFAAIIGMPIAYFLMNRWLENYSSRTTLGINSFLIPILLLAMVSLSCVAFQTIKAAFANPTKTLKSE